MIGIVHAILSQYLGPECHRSPGMLADDTTWIILANYRIKGAKGSLVLSPLVAESQRQVNLGMSEGSRSMRSKQKATHTTHDQVRLFLGQPATQTSNQRDDMERRVTTVAVGLWPKILRAELVDSDS